VSELRIPFDAAPEAREALRGLERYLAGTGLSKQLLELVKLRVSSINGCVFCVDMHWRALREQGESEQRLYSLNHWREQPHAYSPRERAALAWAESVTLVAQTNVPDAVYAEVRAQLSEKETIDLTYAVVAINGWNRLCVALRIPPLNALPEHQP
jgi:AhpD family alkylhydroperoxidase